MIVLRSGGRAGSFRAVLGFTFRHWARQKWLVGGIAAAVVASTAADVLMPLFAGRLVDAVALGASDRAAALDAALKALAVIIALGAGMVVLRHFAFLGIIRLTLRIMTEVAADAFHRVQRFSTEWHANSFAGSTGARSLAVCGRLTFSTTRFWWRCFPRSSCCSGRRCSCPSTGR